MSSKVDSSGWSANHYNKTASFVYSPAYTSAVLDLLDAKPGERILDFGCGSGEVTLEIEKMVKPGTVVGVDMSESMIEKAKANGVQVAFQADIQNPIVFPKQYQGEKFDAVFTNATLHWCKRNPKGVVESAKAVLKPGGRFVGECGGFTNIVGVRSAMYVVLKQHGYDAASMDPFFKPSIEDYRTLLTSSGFEVTHLSLTPRLTPLPTGLRDWLELFVRSSFLKTVDDEKAAVILDEVTEMLRVDLCDTQGNWSLMYVRLRFAAVRV